MRRSRVSHTHPVRRRSGVIASVTRSRRRVHSPVVWVMVSTGFAPSASVNPW